MIVHLYGGSDRAKRTARPCRSGRTILTEKLGRLGAEAMETCQGEADS
jgi:hypothetical protein